MKRLIRSLPSVALAAAACFSAGVPAQPTPAAPAASASAATSDGMTQGEVRKVDRAARTVTLRHGDIVNVGMPAMTRVFRVEDAAALDALKIGDKVRFRVEKTAAGLVVTQVRLAQ